MPVTLNDSGLREQASVQGDALHAALRNLIHDLRQPLSVIESHAFHLRLVTAEENSTLRESVQRIQEQVEVASRLLANAARAVRGAASHLELGDTVTGVSLERTNLEIAAVT